MIEFCTVNLKLKDVDQAGVTEKVCDLSMIKQKGTGSIISFTLKDDISGEPSSFVYKGVLYMIDKRDENYFEAIAVDFVRAK